MLIQGKRLRIVYYQQAVYEESLDGTQEQVPASWKVQEESLATLQALQASVTTLKVTV